MRILFVANNLPYPPHSGGAQRTALLLRSLERLGEVDCAFLQPNPPSAETETALRERVRLKTILPIRKILTRQRSSRWRRVLPGKLGDDIASFAEGGQFRWQSDPESVTALGPTDGYDLIVARYLQTAATFGLFGKQPLALDVDDYDPDRMALRLRHARWWDRLTIRRCLRFSQAAHDRLLPMANHLWVSNPTDLQHAALAGATILPNIPYSLVHDTAPIGPANPASRIFLMVGTMSYSANADGVEAFLQRAWSRIIDEFPQAEFHIAGTGMSGRQKEVWGRIPGVKPRGFVEDLTGLYRQCLSAVAPILAGAGTNIKVLEAASYARTTVLTGVAHRGFEETLPAGAACLRAESIEAMADSCLFLLRNPAHAVNLGQEARKSVLRNYNVDAFHRAVERGCSRALENGNDRQPKGALR